MIDRGRNSIKIVDEWGNFLVHSKPRIVKRLVRAGFAKVICKHPLIVQLTPILRLGASIVPAECVEFIEELKHLTAYKISFGKRTIKPRKFAPKKYTKMIGS